MDVLRIPKNTKIAPNKNQGIGDGDLSDNNNVGSQSQLSFTSDLLRNDRQSLKKRLLTKDSAVSFLNDMRFLMNNLDNSYRDLVINLNNSDRYSLHAIIFTIRSSWFNEAKTNDNISGQFANIDYSFENSGGDLVFNINGVSKEAFDEFISFIYTTTFTINGRNKLDLLKLSKLFELKRFNEDIRDYIKSKLSSNYELIKLFEIVQVADLINDDDLKRVSIEIIVEKINQDRDILKIDMWKEFCRDHVNLVSEIFEYLN